MNNTFSLEQISKTGNLNADLILRQYKLDIMARFMQIESLSALDLHKSKYPRN